jgi:hypothetical protein
MRVKALRGFVVGQGRVMYPGEVGEVPDNIGEVAIATKKAIVASAEPVKKRGRPRKSED